MFSRELNTILAYAIDEAMRTGHKAVGVDHLTLALLRHADNEACKILSGMGVNLQELKSTLDEALIMDEIVNFSERDKIRPTKSTSATLQAAVYEGLKYGSTETESRHLILALSRNANCKSSEFLNARHLGYEKIKDYMREKSMLLPKRQEQKKVYGKELMESLSEQLGNLMNHNGSSKFFS